MGLVLATVEKRGRRTNGRSLIRIYRRYLLFSMQSLDMSIITEGSWWSQVVRPCISSQDLAWNMGRPCVARVSRFWSFLLPGAWVHIIDVLMPFWYMVAAVESGRAVYVNPGWCTFKFFHSTGNRWLRKWYTINMFVPSSSLPITWLCLDFLYYHNVLASEMSSSKTLY
jgi:hypothetical protein